MYENLMHMVDGKKNIFGRKSALKELTENIVLIYCKDIYTSV